MLSLFLTRLSNHRQLGLAQGVLRSSDRKLSADWLQCVTTREVQLPILQSQPLKVVILP